MKQGKQKYNQEHDIHYVSFDNLLRMDPDRRFFVIYDEIDHLLGPKSLRLVEEGEDKIYCHYTPAFLQKWVTMISFSGTMSHETSLQFSYDFPEAVTMKIPSLRNSGNLHHISRVVELEGTLKNTLEKELPAILKEASNTIIIFEDLQKLYEYRAAMDKEKFG